MAGWTAFSEATKPACELAGMDDVPMEQRPHLLFERGPALISKPLEGYLKAKRLGHILAFPLEL